MRGQRSPTSDTCTEGVAVNAAGISGKIARLTLGGLLADCVEQRSVPRGAGGGQQKSADAVVGGLPVTEGLNMAYRG